MRGAQAAGCGGSKELRLFIFFVPNPELSANREECYDKNQATSEAEAGGDPHRQRPPLL